MSDTEPEPLAFDTDWLPTPGPFNHDWILQHAHIARYDLRELDRETNAFSTTFSNEDIPHYLARLQWIQAHALTSIAYSLAAHKFGDTDV